MDVMPVWFPYAVFNDEGDLTGLREDAPKEAKDAYQDYIAELQRYNEENKPIPK